MGVFNKKVILEGPKGKKEVEMMVDTGSQVTLIDKKIADELGLITVGTTLHRYGTERVVPAEIKAVTIRVDGCKSNFLAIARDQNILGADALQFMDAVVDMKKRDIIIKKCEPYTS